MLRYHSVHAWRWKLLRELELASLNVMTGHESLVWNRAERMRYTGAFGMEMEQGTWLHSWPCRDQVFAHLVGYYYGPF